MENKLLDTEKIEKKLKELPLWRLEKNSIIRECSCRDFVSAIGLINSIAVLAEKFDHHPDLNLYGWNKLKITLQTHNLGGLTELDFKLANEIEGLINQFYL